MMNTDNLNREMEKCKSEEFVIKMELEKTKNDFINYLKNEIGDEIKQFDYSNENKPIPYHTPFKEKIKRVIRNITKLFKH